jgi:hypothetical protein
MQEPLTALFKGAFNSAVTLQKAGGGATVLTNGLFERGDNEFAGDRVSQRTRSFQVTVPSAEVVAYVEGDDATIDAVTYRIRDVITDGSSTTFMLTREGIMLYSNEDEPLYSNEGEPLFASS